MSYETKHQKIIRLSKELALLKGEMSIILPSGIHVESARRSSFSFESPSDQSAARPVILSKNDLQYLFKYLKQWGVVE